MPETKSSQEKTRTIVYNCSEFCEIGEPGSERNIQRVLEGNALRYHCSQGQVNCAALSRFCTRVGAWRVRGEDFYEKALNIIGSFS